jgi:hypothetical protein
MPEAPGDPAARLTNSIRSASGLCRIEMAVDGGPVGSGGSGARYITDADGVRWVMKAPFLGGQAHGYLCLNEGLAAQIAWRIGVAAPQAGVVELSVAQLRGFSTSAPEQARFVFASQLIEPGESLTPEAARESLPSDRGGIVALDELIWNTDRKPEHVIARRDDDGEWHLHPIDHGHCFAVADTLAGSLDPTQ